MARPKGSVNKDKVAFRDRMKKYCADHNCDPHEWMADVLNKQKVPMEIKIQAAKELAQYLEPKLKSTEITGGEGGPLRFQIEMISYHEDQTAP